MCPCNKHDITIGIHVHTFPHTEPFYSLQHIFFTLKSIRIMIEFNQRELMQNFKKKENCKENKQVFSAIKRSTCKFLAIYTKSLIKKKD